MKTAHLFIPFAIIILIAASCGTTKNAYYSEGKEKHMAEALPDEEDLKRTLYLVGDPAFENQRAEFVNTVGAEF